ncbi:MAG: hypothetical protein IJW49_02095 [Clostridia bacterium]|nr:hypothetical protein [Clostridia bacterium]
MAYLSSYMFQVSVVLGILTLVLSVLPVAYWLYKLIRSIHTLYLLSHGGFSIVTDTASYLSRGEPSRIGRHTVDAIYFTTYGRYVAEGTAFEISSNGNEFYLVILHTRKPTIALAYHTKIYQYEEQKNTDREKEYETDD